MKRPGIIRFLLAAIAAVVPLVRTYWLGSCAVTFILSFVVVKRSQLSPEPETDKVMVILGLAVLIGVGWIVATYLPSAVPQVDRAIVQTAIALLVASQIGVVLAKLSTPGQVESPAPGDLIITAWGTDLSRHNTDEALSEILLIAMKGDYPTAIAALEQYRNQRNLDPETTSSLDRLLATWQCLAKDPRAKP